MHKSIINFYLCEHFIMVKLKTHWSTTKVVPMSYGRIKKWYISTRKITSNDRSDRKEVRSSGYPTEAAARKDIVAFRYAVETSRIDELRFIDKQFLNRCRSAATKYFDKHELNSKSPPIYYRTAVRRSPQQRLQEALENAIMNPETAEFSFCKVSKTSPIYRYDASFNYFSRNAGNAAEHSDSCKDSSLRL